MVNGKIIGDFQGSSRNLVIEKNTYIVMNRKENQCRDNNYYQHNQQKKNAREQGQGKTCDFLVTCCEIFSDNRKKSKGNEGVVK